MQGKQLDVNYATSTGIGSITMDPVDLPHGRYTFFSSADPADCVTSVALLDHNGATVVDDSSWRRAAASTPPPGVVTVATQQTIPTMVQQELASGAYRVRVTAKTGCAWRVEQILNYMLSDETPLKPAPLPAAPDLDVNLGVSSTDLNFRIDTPGMYRVRWSVTPCATYSLDLVRPGSVEHLAEGNAASAPPGGVIGPMGSDGPMFLGTGDWTARVNTRCFWQIEVSPWRGSIGGGTQGFAP